MKELSVSFEEDIPMRLDIFLTHKAQELSLPHLTRSQIKKLVEQEGILVNENPVKAGFLLIRGMTIRILDVTPPSSTLTPSSEVPFTILFEDEDLLIVDKPAGVVVHPGAGVKEGTLVQGVLDRLKDKEGNRPGIVHRLDKDTSGILVVAKNLPIHTHLSEQFRQRTVGRMYLALVLSTPRRNREVDRSDSGFIEGAIGRHATRRKEMTVVREGGRSATTEWCVRERMSYGAFLEVRLKTGRTHQIRVHLSHIGSPVIGDPVYGDFSPLPEKFRSVAKAIGRQALHAHTLQFSHPKTGERMCFESPIPSDMERLLQFFRENIS